MRRIHIELLAPPYSGHLHPVLAMARALAEHQSVTVLSTPSVQASIARAGLRAESILSAADEQALWAIANPSQAVKAHPLRMHAQLRQALSLMAHLRQALSGRWARQRPDIVIADFTLPVAGLLARELGMSWWTSLPSPCVLETVDGPPAYWGGLQPARHAPARGWQAMARRLTRSFKRGVHAWHRQQMRALGLPAIYRPDGSEAVYSPECILALGVPELEFNCQWPSALRFVGPQLLTPPSAHPVPPFRPGRAHLLVTAGTHLAWAKQRWADAAQDLARRHPDWEVHVNDGCEQATAEERKPHQHTEAQPPNFHRLPFVHYERDLPRYAMVLHHGGAGVMYHCLRAGIPAIVHPLDYDQFDHAARLQAQCAALWLKRLADLPSAFERALHQRTLFSGVTRLQQAVLRHANTNELQDCVDTWRSQRLGR